MCARPPAGDQRTFTAALAAALVLSALFLLVLALPLSESAREVVGSVGFAVGGLALFASVSLSARRADGSRRRAWMALSWASGLGLLGTVWTLLAGGDPVQDTSAVGDALVAAGLVLTVFGLLGLSDTTFGGARLLVNWLDGVVTGCAVLVIATVLVFSRLVEAHNIAERPQVLLFPVLDVALVTVALLLVFRQQGNRSFCALVGFGFVLYAVADLTFAVLHAQGAYLTGTPHDAMWVAAYLLLAAAARHPAALVAPRANANAGSFDLQGTALVFGLLVLAAVVQWLFASGPLTGTLAVLWVALVMAVGLRQVLLVSDNQRLRTGLEHRVREQTADLRRITRQTEVLLNSVGDGIYGVDLHGRITFVNPSAALALGHEPEALLGRHAHNELHADEPEETGHDRGSCYVRQSIVHGRLVSSEEDTYVRRDGSRFPVEVTASPLVDEDRISGAVVAFRDVTQRREVDRMKDEFLSVVSHELRTPLTSIRGSLGMLGSGAVADLTPQAQRMVAIAVQSSDRLTRLINDILDVERIRSGKLRMEFVAQDAADLVHGTAREMAALAESEGVRLVLGRTEGRVAADSDRIVQTLTNLVGNAIKFSPAGGCVRLEVVEDGDQVTFSVSDEGRGIPSDKLQAIFEPFEQVDSSDSREKGGTGIGLAISRGIVERHGGRIWAESEPGAGTVIRFRLPRAGGRVQAAVGSATEGGGRSTAR